jgi:putative transcriptional regulator
LRPARGGSQNAPMSASLRNHFLIAMPGMEDPNFAHSITYLCEHSEEGAMGLVVNRALDLSYDEIFDHLDITDFTRGNDTRVLAGGPVKTDRGFVLHRNCTRQWHSTLALSEDISLTTSRDILEAMAHGEGPRDALVALGYAGWGPGQLEREIACNAWLTLPAEPSVLFDVPLERRAHVAARQLGINLDLLSSSCGTA